MHTLRVQTLCQPCVADGLQKGLIFFIQQAEVRLQGHTIWLRLVPSLHAGVYLGKHTRTIQIPLPERHCFRCFPGIFPERKLPIIQTLIVRIPCQPAALQAVLSRHQIDLGRAFFNVNIPILVHVLRFDDLLRAILFEEHKQLVQLGHVVRSGSCRKGAVHQRMANVRFQKSFCHIGHSGTRITDKVDGAFRGCSHRLAARRQPEVLRALLVGWRVFLPDGCIQPNLCAADQSIRASGRDQDPGRARSESYCPSAVIRQIKAGDALHDAALFQRCLSGAERKGLQKARRTDSNAAAGFPKLHQSKPSLSPLDADFCDASWLRNAYRRVRWPDTERH